MLNYFPSYFSRRAIVCYIAALVTVSLLYANYAMYWYWWVFGIVEVVGFFAGSHYLTTHWAQKSSKEFQKSLFGLSLALRIFAVFFLYWFFDTMTGQPFMFAAADSIGYHEEASWMAECFHGGYLDAYLSYIQGQSGVSDVGYPFWLGLQYIVTGNSIIIARIIKAVLSAWMSVLVYQLAMRNFGESTGRMAGIFCALMPNLIIYCGMHLKETEMVFLTVAFLERTDYLMRQPKFKPQHFILPLLLGGSLFLFRTVLGVAAMGAWLVSVLFTSKEIIKTRNKVLLSAMLGVVLLFSLGGKIFVESQRYWERRNENQELGLYQKTARGNQMAKYAGAAVFAPMIFTIPFPTMVETEGQETFRMQHGGNFDKNITSFFTILALFLLVWRKQWRSHTLIGTFTIAYLAILTLSAFAQSERFHIPSLPIELIFAACGVSMMTNRHKKYFNAWLVLMFVADVAWAWFKLKGRGMA